MSKTVEELAKTFRAGLFAHLGANPYATVHEGDRAGIAAVIRAVRDEFITVFRREYLEEASIETFLSAQVVGMLDEILGSDAGSEKVAGACADGTVVQRQRYGENDRQSKDGAEVSPRHPDPATDPAPAVCEWTVKGRSYTYTDVRTQCGDDVVLSLFATAGRIGTCGKCHRPIKFTEAKT